MKNKAITVDDIRNGINKTVSEIQDILAKSGMWKNEDQDLDDQGQQGQEMSEGMDQDAGAEGEGMEQEGQEMGQEMGDEGQEMSQEMGDEGMDQEAGAEDQMGEGEEDAGFDEQVAMLSDEELDHLLELAFAEKQKRQSPEGQAAQPPMQQPAPQPGEFEKSMKEDFAKLTKSISDLAKEVASIKANKLAKSKKVTSKPVDFSSVDVLEKSTENTSSSKDKLSKSETYEILLNKMRSGDKKITSEHVYEVSSCKTEEELKQTQEKFARLGILPK